MPGGLRVAARIDRSSPTGRNDSPPGLACRRATTLHRQPNASGANPPDVRSSRHHPIDTQIALDARKGSASTGRFARLEMIEIPADADLDAVLAREIARNREAAARQGVVAAAVSLDPLRWRLTRALVTEHEPDDGGAGTMYQILHLARPLLDTLEAGGA